jgi:hypothetical protein
MMNMNNEEFDRKMSFIVEQQAQFASDIQQLKEAQAETMHVISRTVESIGQLGEVVTRLANVTHVGFTEVNAKINALVDAQIRSEEKMARSDESFAHSEERMARSDENFARFEERMIRSDENFARFEERMLRSEENFARSEERMALIEEKLLLIEEHSLRNEKNVAITDQAMKNLIAIVERHISDGPHSHDGS